MPGPGTEDEQLGQGVGAQAVGAVDADAGDLAGGVQPVQWSGAVDVGVDAAHHVVHHRPDRDQLADRVDVLVVQAELPDDGEPGGDDRLTEVAQVQVDDLAVRRVDGPALLRPP